LIFWSVILAWFGVAFAAEAMGMFAHEFNAAAAVVLLLMSALLVRRPAIAPADAHQSTSMIGVILCIAGILMVPSHWTIRLFGVALWFWGLHTMSGARSEFHGKSEFRGGVGRSSPFAILAVGTLVFATLQYLFGNSLTSWYIGQGISDAVTGSGLRTMGPTFSGTGLVAFALVIIIVGFVSVPQHKLGVWCGVSAVGIVIVYVAYLIIFSKTQPEPLAVAVTWQQKVWHAIYPEYMPAVLAVVLGIPVAIFLSGASRVTWQRDEADSARSFALDPAAPSGRRGLALLVIPMLVLGVVLFVNAPGEKRTGKGTGGQLRYALYKEGFHNWMTPNKQRYGSRSAGMFGNLPTMLNCMGWEGDIVPTLDEATLADRDLLFIANPKDSLSVDTIARIDRFVEAGGSLLMLGDHTWRKSDEPGGDKVLDEAIQKTNIRFNFDSAYYFIGGWLHSLQYWSHQTTVHLRDETNESGCVVGASLDISYPATPLIVGRYGYADKGKHVRDPRLGYMDNGLLDKDERLGDMVLVAAQNVGKGRVIVVGDTSGFVNAIQTQTWRFTSRVFDWLGSTGQATVSRWRDVLGMLLLGGVAVIVVRTASRNRNIVPVACAVMIVSGVGARRWLDSKSTPQPLTGDVALVDLSHVGLHSMEAWRDDAISGIYLNLMREGYFSLGAKDFDEAQLLASKIFVTIAPSKSYSNSELDSLDQFMNQGGTVLLCTGWEEKAGSESLLSKYGLDIANRPQGRATNPIPNTTIMPNYWEVWPVMSDPEYGPQADTIATLRFNPATKKVDPTIVRRRVGAGQLIVIGDTKMLFCRNFETEDGAVMPNVQFFNWLVTNLIKQGAT